MYPIYSTILFDFDGTLTSSLELWLQAFHYAFAKFDLKLADEIIIERCFYREFATVVAEFNLPCPIQFGQEIKEGLSIVFEEATLFSGVQDVLLNCVNQNIKLAVVTSSPRSIVERALKNLEIDSFFSTLVTADDIVNFKPHPEPVLLALKRLEGIESLEGLKNRSNKVALIGDSQADILAGRAVGIKTGLFYPEVHKQFYDFEKLKEADPHFVFHHYNDLHDYLFCPLPLEG